MVEHHPALPYAQLGGFITHLRAIDGVAARALEFAILTASRSGEVLGARWSEVDLEKRVWTIAAKRMKGGREHRVPLSDQALTILKRVRRDQAALGANRAAGDAFVFPGALERRPLSNMAMTMILRRLKRDDVTVHGFRSTFRDWVAETGTFPREVAEAALATR